MRLLLCMFPSHVLVLNVSSRNIPGPGGGSFPGGSHVLDSMYPQVQVTQQTSYQRPPTLSLFPVPSAYPSGHASATPRLEHFAPQLGMGHVHPPPALPRHFRGGILGRSNISEPQDRRGPSSGYGSSYEFVPSHATHSQVYVRQPN